MTSKKSDLYRWDRYSKPKEKVYARNQRATSDDDIQDWILKVEDASAKAAAATFGTKYAPVPNNHVSRGKSAVASRIEDIHIHDAAYAEAQDLLNQWVHDKLDLDSGLDYSEETWQKKTQTEIRQEWDHLMGNDEAEEERDYKGTQSRRKPSARDTYDILKADDDVLVDEVIQNMMDKEVIQDEFIHDLGLEGHEKSSDPRTKMHLRHQQVKENREKREQQKKNKLREKQSQKEAHFQARQLVIKEDQAKALVEKKEEEAIQKNMAQIRKEMEQDRRLREDQRNREHKEKEERERRIREEMERQNEESRQKQMKAMCQAEHKKRKIMERLQEMEASEVTENLKLLQRCFSAWYNIVIQRHLAMGKAKATTDWRLLLKTFNAWKYCTRSRRAEREAALYENEMKIIQRKNLIADQHHKNRLMRQCFLAWQLYIVQSHNEQLMNSARKETKNKMAAFLEAAATGKLWSARSDDDTGQRSMSPDVSESGGSTVRQVNAMFTDKGRQVAPPGSARSDSTISSRSERTSSGRNRQNNRKPTDAWLINRKHIQVTKEDLAKVGQGEGDTEVNSGVSENISPVKYPNKAPFVANKFEHRHAAQQKILESQQKQITEQQRLIEEMQHLQKQQILHQQLTQQQLLREKLDSPAVQQLIVAESADKKSKVVNGTKVHKEGGTVLGDGSNVEMNGDRSKKKSVDLRKNDGSETDRSATTATSAATSGMSGKSSMSSLSKVTDDSKHVKFLKTMEERAQERIRLKGERDDKRRKAEEDRLKLLQAAEEEKLKEEDAEKRRRLDAYREKKRLEKQKDQEKQAFMEHLKKLTGVAEEHGRLAVMKYRGWLPWRHLVEMTDKNMEKARNHHMKTLQRKVLLSWHCSVQEDLTHKRALADDMFKYILIRRSFNNWKKVGQYMSIQEEKAVRHYGAGLKVKVIRAWSDYATEEKMAGWRKERKAKEHNTVRIVRTTFRAWRRYPEVIAEVAARQKRLKNMRQKVASLLSDFEVDRSSSSINKSNEFFT